MNSDSPESISSSQNARRIYFMSETQIAYLMLFTAPGMFAVNMLVARWMAFETPPVALAFWRWLGVLLLMLLLRGKQLWLHRQHVQEEWKDLLVLGSLGMGICGAFVYIGAETTQATNIGLLYSSSPVMIVLLAWKFYKERLSQRQILGGVICLGGVLWIVMRGSFETLLNLDLNVGDLWILTAVVSWAVYVVILKFRPTGMPMTTRFTAICLFGSMILLPFYLWESIMYQTMPVTPDSMTAVALLVFIAGFGAYQAYGKAQAVLGAAKGGLILYLNPLYVALMAWLFLGEPLQHYHYLGAGLILPGIFLVNLPTRTQ